MRLFQESLFILVGITANILVVDADETGPDVPSEAKPDEPKDAESEAKGPVTDDQVEPRPYTVTREILNEWTSQYLLVVRGMKKDMSEEDKKTLDVIEKLVIQSWIRLLQPEMELLQQFLPSDSSSTMEQVKEDFLKSLKDLGRPAVEEALLDYGCTPYHDIKKNVHNQALKMGYSHKRANDIYSFHTWFCAKMCIQSFVFDFLPEPYGETYTFKLCGDRELEVHIAKVTMRNWEDFFKFG